MSEAIDRVAANLEEYSGTEPDGQVLDCVALLTAILDLASRTDHLRDKFKEKLRAALDRIEELERAAHRHHRDRLDNVVDRIEALEATFERARWPAEDKPDPTVKPPTYQALDEGYDGPEIPTRGEGTS